MYIPGLSSLLPSILVSNLWPQYSTTARPRLSSPKPSLSFRPIHAHSAALHRTSDVLFTAGQDPGDYHASNEVTLVSDPNYLDTPLPHIAALPLSLSTKRQVVRRPVNISRDRLNEYRRKSMLWQQSPKEEWEDVEIEVPDVTDRQTIITLAKMASDAYVVPDSSEWWPLDGYNAVSVL